MIAGIVVLIHAVEFQNTILDHPIDSVVEVKIKKKRSELCGFTMTCSRRRRRRNASSAIMKKVSRLKKVLKTADTNLNATENQHMSRE